MTPSKNQQVELVVTDMSEDGSGIGHTADGYTLFVKDAVPGDRLIAHVTKAGRRFGYARVFSPLEASPDRVEAPCPLAGPCGGCQLQALSYEAQLRFKEKTVRDCFTRIGGFAAPPLEPILASPRALRYRNKAQVPFGTGRDGQTVCGYFAAHSHRIVPQEDCLLNEEGFDEVLRTVREHAARHGIPPYNEETGQGLLRHVLIKHFQNAWMVCLVINGRRYPFAEELVASLRQIPGMVDISLNVNRERTNVILGSEILPLYGPGYITASIGALRFEVSPLAFFQVNSLQTEQLYGEALERAALTGSETVWDLYCGTGTISLFLAQRARKVYGVEIVAPAIDNARRNAALNHMENTEFFVGRSEEIFPQKVLREGLPADVVVLDPPRKGCDRVLLDALLAVAPQRIVYVSCDPATCARDCRILADGGYTLRSVRPVDMFPQTTGIECVSLLQRMSNI